MNKARYALILAAIVAFAFVLRVGAAARFVGLDAPPSESANPDQLEYEAIAWHLASGKGYTLGEGQVTGIRTPGTSLMLLPVYLLTDRSFALGRVWFALISALTCAVTAWAVRPYVTPWVGLVAAAILALYPGHLYSAMHFVSEVPFAFWVAVGVGCSLRAMFGRSYAWAIAAGVAWGAAIHTRPNFLLVVPAACTFACIDLYARRWRRVTVVAIQAIVVVALLAPWVVRNYFVFGSPALTTISGQGLWGAHNPVTFNDPRYFGSWYPTSKLIDDEHPISGNEVERNQLALTYAKDEMRKSRHLMPALTVAKFRQLLSPFIDTPNRVTYWAFAFGWIAVAPFILVGGWVLWRRSRLMTFVLLASVAAILATTFMFYGSARFRDAIAPVFILFAAAGVVALFRRGDLGPPLSTDDAPLGRPHTAP